MSAADHVDAGGRPLDEATCGHFFCPPSSALFDDPVCGTELRRLALEDPDIIAAVADVDRTQIRDALNGTPDDRLRSACENWRGIARLRDGMG